MDNNIFSLVAFAGSLFAGVLGALSGLGGGIVITPLLVFMLGVDIHFAMGAALLAVIATSLGSSSAYVKAGYSNLNVSIFFATATTSGAVIGAFLTHSMPKRLLFVIFGIVLIISVIQTFTQKKDKGSTHPSKVSQWLKLNGTYPKNGEMISYKVQNVGFGWIVMWLAGLLSGLLGIGSGAVKVLAMDRIMKFPFKVSTTTSNFMIGLTACASVGIYYHQGYITVPLVMPVMLGVLSGAFLGALFLPKISSSKLRLLFSILVIFIALGMLYKGIIG